MKLTIKENKMSPKYIDEGEVFEIDNEYFIRVLGMDNMIKHFDETEEILAVSLTD